MVKVNLLRSIPKSNRKVKNRLDKKNKSVIKISKKFGAKYFDGERKYGYGGYKYDGRWQGVAKDIIKHFSLKKGSKVLDVGCAKGYLVRDLLDQCIDAYGIDISRYALENADKKVKNRLFYGNAKKINFKNNFFDAAISINCIHNLKKKYCIMALKEIQRVSKGKCFVQIDSYETAKEKRLFLDWVLTAETHGSPEEWYKIFNKAEYKGDWYWTKV